MSGEIVAGQLVSGIILKTSNEHKKTDRIMRNFRNADGSYKTLNEMTESEKDSWMRVITRNRRIEPSDENRSEASGRDIRRTEMGPVVTCDNWMQTI